MSEEETKATENAAAAAPAPAEKPANGKGKKNGGKDQKPRDETPIEELYDLSKPIPKVRSHVLRFEAVIHVGE